jgi:hypothetical protein
MKYQITKTDLQINNRLHSENSEVELTNEQTKGIEDYLLPIVSPALSGVALAKTVHSELDSESVSNVKNKTKTKRVKK